MMTAALELPDPLAFAADALAARGALVESTDDGALVLSADGIARELGIPEECSLATSGVATHDGAVSCAIGSPLLERLAESARAVVPRATLAAASDPPRPGQARALAERFGLRNAICEIASTCVLERDYVIAWFSWRAEADDRYDGIVRLALNAADGAEPDASFATLADAVHSFRGLTAGLFASATADPGIVDLLVRRATRAARAAIAPAGAAVTRRHERDHRRICDYYAALAGDARSPKRRIEQSAIEEKVSHLVAERDGKLRDLAGRYTLRARLQPAAIVVLTVPAVRVVLHVRRRKREGDLALTFPAGAAGLDRLSCAACGEPTARPALCDDALHVLCETCVPHAQGRPECAACRPGAPGVRPLVPPGP